MKLSKLPPTSQSKSSSSTGCTRSAFFFLVTAGSCLAVVWSSTAQDAVGGHHLLLGTNHHKTKPITTWLPVAAASPLPLPQAMAQLLSPAAAKEVALDVDGSEICLTLPRG